ncbi:MAG: hypothetical protein R6V40_04240 [Candidatus Moraniibacteriota bacterium]
MNVSWSVIKNNFQVMQTGKTKGGFMLSSEITATPREERLEKIAKLNYQKEEVWESEKFNLQEKRILLRSIEEAVETLGKGIEV